MSASLPKLVHPTIEEGSPSSEMNGSQNWQFLPISMMYQF